MIQSPRPESSVHSSTRGEYSKTICIVHGDMISEWPLCLWEATHWACERHDTCKRFGICETYNTCERFEIDLREAWHLWEALSAVSSAQRYQPIRGMSPVRDLCNILHTSERLAQNYLYGYSSKQYLLDYVPEIQPDYMCYEYQLTDTISCSRPINSKAAHQNTARPWVGCTCLRHSKHYTTGQSSKYCKKYADAFQRWNSWAKSKGLQALPTTGYELALYLAFLIKSAKSMATIYSAVYGIAWANQKMSMASPTEYPIIKHNYRD